jgi:hypothetical protein
VIPTAVLSAQWDQTQEPSPLSEITFLQVYRSLGSGDYLARKSSRIETVQEGYTHLLTEEQLFYALPYDCRLKGHEEVQICTILCAHAAEVRSAVAPPQAAEPVKPIPRLAQPKALQQPALVPLTQVYTAPLVSKEAIQEALLPVRRVYGSIESVPQMRLNLSKPVTRRKLKDVCLLFQSRGATTPGIVHSQQALLKLALQQLTHTSHQAPTGKVCLCEVLKHLLRWQRQTRQRVVNPVLCADADGSPCWNLMVSAPDEVLAACAA